MQTEITLGQVGGRLAMLEVSCRNCSRFGRLSVARLIEDHGAHMGMNSLLSLLSADCPQRNAQSIYDKCGAIFPQLSALFG